MSVTHLNMAIDRHANRFLAKIRPGRRRGAPPNVLVGTSITRIARWRCSVHSVSANRRIQGDPALLKPKNPVCQVKNAGVVRYDDDRLLPLFS